MATKTGRMLGYLLLIALLAGCAALRPDPEEAFRTDLDALSADLERWQDTEDYPAALSELDSLIRRYPDVAPAWALRAEWQVLAGRHEHAMADLRQASALAAEQGRPERAGRYNARLSAILAEPPHWVVEQGEAARELPDEQDVRDAAEFWEALREEAATLAAEGDYGAAEEILEQGADLAEAYFGSAHRFTVLTLVDLADVSLARSDHELARSLHELALERSRTQPGPAHPWTLDLKAALADLHAAEGDHRGALELAQNAARAVRQAWGEDSPRVLTHSLAVAARLDAAGKTREALELLDHSCRRARDLYGDYHPEHADCLERRAIVLGRAGDLTSATTDFEEVLRVRAALLPPGSEPLLRTRLDLGSMQRRAGDLERAVTNLERLRADVADLLGVDTALHEAVTEALARTRLDAGDVDQAAELAEAVLTARDARYSEEHPLRLDALNLLGAAWRQGGRLAAAEEAWTAVLAGYRSRHGVDHLATITAMSNLGVLLEAQGRLDEAEPLLREAVDRSEALLGPGHPQTLAGMNNLALLHESQGNYSRAEPLYLLPLEVLESTLGEQHPDTIAVGNNLAFLYMKEGRYQEAGDMFRRLYAAWTEAVGADHPDALRGRNNLGRVLRQSGDLEGAREHVSAAHEGRLEAFGEQHPDSIRSLLDLGLIDRDAGDLDAAEQRLGEAVVLSEAVLGDAHPYTFESLNALADVREAQQGIDAALRLRQTVFERRNRFYDRMLWVTSDNAREGYIRLHREEFNRYLGLLPQVEDEEQAGRALLEAALQRKGLLLKVTSEIRQIAQLGMDPELADLAEVLTDSKEALAARTLAGPGEEESPEAHLARIRELEAEIEALQGQLGRASLRYRESVARLTLDDVIAELPRGSALVDFLEYETVDGARRLLAGVLQHHGQGRVTTGLVQFDDLDRITELIHEYREIIQDPGALDEDVEYFGQLVWEALWKPLDDQLEGERRIYVVPDGVLNLLPFDALVDGDGRFLLETTELHTLSSSRDLIPSALPRADDRVLVLGGPDYDSEEVAGRETLAAARERQQARVALRGEADGNGAEAAVNPLLDGTRGMALARMEARAASDLESLRAAARGLRGLSFSPLPGAELEGELIGRASQQRRVAHDLRIGDAAQERLLFEIEQPPRVLHLATHGFFLRPDDELRDRLVSAERSLDNAPPPAGDNPLLRAGLAFAGANSNAPFLGELDTRNDGILTALEVLSLDLAGTELAVLSACDTGLGEIYPGEGIYGLRRAFQEAGVQEVITSLWEVSDAGTQALMDAFYQRLLQGEAPRAALRGAQLELMESPRWGYPFIWSAFVLVGHHGQDEHGR